MVRVLLFSIIILLISCSTFEVNPTMVRNTSKIVVIENPLMTTDGSAFWNEDGCIIQLKKYPICLAHEMRHCLEGHFHPKEILSSENCY